MKEMILGEDRVLKKVEKTVLTRMNSGNGCANAGAAGALHVVDKMTKRVMETETGLEVAADPSRRSGMVRPSLFRTG